MTIPVNSNRVVRSGRGYSKDGTDSCSTASARVSQSMSEPLPSRPCVRRMIAVPAASAPRRTRAFTARSTPFRSRPGTPASGGHAESERRQVAAGQGQRDDPGHQDGRTLLGRQLGQQRARQEQRVDDHRVRLGGGQQLLDGGVLTLTRPDEDVLDVEGDRGERRHAFPLRETGDEIAVVEVRVRWERDVGGPGGADRGGEPRPGEEPYGVAASDQMGCDRQQRDDVAVDRHGGDEIAGHDGLPSAEDAHLLGWVQA